MNKNLSKITIGTRGSDLALKQTDIVSKKILALFPHIKIEVKIIKTKGDKDKSPIPLDSVGKTWFTEEIEEELAAGTIDLAVHSLKDLPEVLPPGLSLGAFPEREDARDALVSRDNMKLKDLPRGAIVGTDSTRRKVQILAMRPDLTVTSVRGNVPTRIKKLRDAAEGEQTYDALVLAAAGLIRLDLQKEIAQYFSIKEIMPAPGQGVLAIEINNNSDELRMIVAAINDPELELLARTEREFSKHVGGGCKEPVGAYATLKGDTLHIDAFVASKDHSKIERDSISGPKADSSSLAQELAERMLIKVS